MDGIFNINKPSGMTSHDVVARVRRISGQRKTGHAGTLDPMATGVLPVVLGKATRLVEYLSDADKAYRAAVVLGATSDTYDAEGTLTPTPASAMPSPADIEQALEGFRGEIKQVPPMHSALKVGGKKLYELARAGIEVERVSRAVIISRLELEAYVPPSVHLFVECSKGTYIRSLAHDLGWALGTGAYLGQLERTRHGPFTLEGSITLEGLQAAFEEGTWEESLYPPDYILEGWSSHAATPQQAIDIVQGKPVDLPPPGAADRPLIKATTQARELLAILYWDGEAGVWRPRKVFMQFAAPAAPERTL